MKVKIKKSLLQSVVRQAYADMKKQAVTSHPGFKLTADDSNPSGKVGRTSMPVSSGDSPMIAPKKPPVPRRNPRLDQAGVVSKMRPLYQDIKNLLNDYERNRTSPVIRQTLSKLLKGGPRQLSPDRVRNVIIKLHEYLDSIRGDQGQLRKMMNSLQLPKQQWQPQAKPDWQERGSDVPSMPPQEAPQHQAEETPQHEAGQTQAEQDRERAGRQDESDVKKDSKMDEAYVPYSKQFPIM